MFLKNLDLVVDVETIGIFNPRVSTTNPSKMLIPNAVFNVGLVLSYRGQVLLKESVGIDEFWFYPEHRIMDFYRKNFDKDGNDFTVTYPTFVDFLNEYFYPLLKSFKGQANIKLWSYNAGFDSRAFTDTALLENHTIPRVIQKNWNCLMVLASTLLMESPKFYNWVVENEFKHRNYEFISPKGNIRIKAETVYRYITQDVSFIEEHKGMQDAEIETRILEWIKTNKGWSKINARPEGGSWQLLNYLARPFQKKSQAHGLIEDKTIRSRLLTIENDGKFVKMFQDGHLKEYEE